MTTPSTVLKVAALALLAGSAALPAHAGVPLNGPAANGLNTNALYPNAFTPSAITLHDLTTNGGAGSAAGHAFRVRHGASGVDVNQLRIRAIVLPGESGWRAGE